MNITEEYDRNYTAVLIQGKEGNMFEKTNVRNRWAGDDSRFCLLRRSIWGLGKAGLCSVHRAYSHENPQDQVFILMINWSHLPADVVMLVVLGLCDLSFYFIMQFLSLSCFLCVLYFSLTAQFLKKRIVKSIKYMWYKSGYRMNYLEVIHTLDRSHWCKKDKKNMNISIPHRFSCQCVVKVF